MFLTFHEAVKFNEIGVIRELLKHGYSPSVSEISYLIYRKDNKDLFDILQRYVSNWRDKHPCFAEFTPKSAKH